MWKTHVIFRQKPLDVVFGLEFMPNASPGMAKESSYSPERKLDPREETAKDYLRLFHDEEARMSLI